ncbi:cytochrome-c peroxidase [Gluconacetobacter tumulicola]|uniref:C-type cytochrome n=1 Tax=Gluconacetobacter tumulicola TaxID=1017177 RepID=A0A7W4P8Y7_9PROT|nr:cytochrome c peroxidase [Gluconacetobacter tumulicola]MBB2178470.1 c-type cytochrome [Gluconacetobacter tumulicola]
MAGGRGRTGKASRSAGRIAGWCVLAILLSAPCGAGTVRAAGGLSPAALLGRQLFFDSGLSASGRQSCASCHDPANHYAPANARRVQMGGAALDRAGIRAVPTLTYRDENPDFSVSLENPDESASGPGGGYDWDGRMPSVAAQSASPLTTPFEMANPDLASVRARVRRNPDYVQTFTKLFGADIFATPDRLVQAMGTALAAFQHEDTSFHPYSSKYDFYTRGQATLSAQEQRGMALFNDADRANCASCHTAGQGPGRDGATSVGQFTDFFFKDIGVPANPDNAPAGHRGYDMGLCGPLRADLTLARDPANRAYCGLFMTPTLRNVASRHVFFHNGALKSLRDVVEFYVTRDTDPDRWYGRQDAALPYDGLPPDLRGNVDRADMPFAAQTRGGRPILSEREVDDLVAFLKTLTDGYRIPSVQAK